MNEKATFNKAVELAGKYLTFNLSSEQYGIEILKVIEIIGVMNITRVPKSPEFVKGVINLRGKIIPVMDLRLRFGLDSRAYDEKTCIIVVHIKAEQNTIAIGMIVDTVLEVRDFDEKMIAATPEYGASLDTSFIRGMGKFANGQVTILLDIDLVLAKDESELLAQVSESATSAP